jgi:pyruvate kinase
MSDAEDQDLRSLLERVRALRARLTGEAERHLESWPALVERAGFRAGRANLAQYLALREHDLRPLQAALQPWGVSSLGRSESRVLHNVDAVIRALEALCATGGGASAGEVAAGAAAGLRQLHANALELLGPARAGRETRIMVTLSPEFALEVEPMTRLAQRGMDCARINCGHDSAPLWRQMIETVRAVERRTSRPCRVLMDLAGPRMRTEQVIVPDDGRRVQAGDRILLTYEPPAPRPDFEFQASCGEAEALQGVPVGAAASIRDGRIAGEIIERRPEGLVLAVAGAGPKGQRLQPDRGINFPGTALPISPLTAADLADLEFVAAHADGVSYSFVQRPEDVALLQAELRRLRPGRPPMPIVAKVETRLAFANLPEIIVQAAAANPFGVMIARGDLAVEIGFERLAEVQEEILWLCEAAHVPVIWATQVLDRLVRKGTPVRGEYTDAAMGSRAECVMLNKGAFVDAGVIALDDILRRMELHQSKKTAQLRALHAWRRDEL